MPNPIQLEMTGNPPRGWTSEFEVASNELSRIENSLSQLWGLELKCNQAPGRSSPLPDSPAGHIYGSSPPSFENGQLTRAIHTMPGLSSVPDFPSGSVRTETPDSEASIVRLESSGGSSSQQ